MWILHEACRMIVYMSDCVTYWVEKKSHYNFPIIWYKKIKLWFGDWIFEEEMEWGSAWPKLQLGPYHFSLQLGLARGDSDSGLGHTSSPIKTSDLHKASPTCGKCCILGIHDLDSPRHHCCWGSYFLNFAWCIDVSRLCFLCSKGKRKINIAR